MRTGRTLRIAAARPPAFGRAGARFCRKVLELDTDCCDLAPDRALVHDVCIARYPDDAERARCEHREVRAVPDEFQLPDTLEAVGIVTGSALAPH